MSDKEWRKQHAAELVEYTRQWRIRNPKRFKAYNRAYAKRKYAEDPVAHRKRQAEKSRKNRVAFQEFKKTLKCERCDENSNCCLDFHHTDTTKKEIRVSRLSRFSLARIKREVEKCIVLCANCHRKEHEN